MGCSYSKSCEECVDGGPDGCGKWWDIHSDWDWSIWDPEDEYVSDGSCEDDYRDDEEEVTVSEGNEKFVRCVSCGEVVRGKWNYCLWCGAEVPGMYCPKCGACVLKEWNRCPQCGEGISEAGEACMPVSSVPIVSTASVVYDEDIPF